jgi:hypothetical protein
MCLWIHFFGFLWYETAMHQTTVLSYKMHSLCRKGHAMFSQSRVFSSIRVPQKQQTQKITPFEAHVQKNAIYCILTGFCEHTRSKAHQDRHFFLRNVLSLPTFKLENSKKQGLRFVGKT